MPQASTNLPSRPAREQGRRPPVPPRDASWVNAREDRAAIVAWLAIAARRTRSTLLAKSLTTLLSTGSLSLGTEAALRVVMLRERRIAARFSHELAPAAVRARAGAMR